MNLYHYYDKTIGPFRNLSDISVDEANRVLKEIAEKKPNVQCAKRNPEYMQMRTYYEDIYNYNPLHLVLGNHESEVITRININILFWKQEQVPVSRLSPRHLPKCMVLLIS